ncbi:MAG TPA: flavodoxin-dependent (E)-4-hydroxy-3-methylbut-2-enyl-diphosphate synthase [Methylomusa anaerophila]|nr:flavodoxin-dependent (E)-4-hydroxy-3-methylbut-2-enyl-diphosphate synthase [Methylomusa anaerophila]HML87023.1 flavodoxin-dependent (E)-4-hydroxy-3-methylbut-2-enyl-diphosphate synthase [Methylomusa anaerophila]
MQRKKTRPIRIGDITVGGEAPISVQSMTNTRTDDVDATVKQIEQLQTAGCDIVRIAIPDMAAAQAVEQIKKATKVPLVADIHFDFRLAIAVMERGIDALRLNPGNIQAADHVAAVVKQAKKSRIPIRIGVNAGSLEQSILAKYGGRPTADAMVESAMGHVNILERLGFHDIKISLKAHDVPLTVQAYRMMSETVDYPLHLGITEAGTVKSGVIKSAVGLGALLAEGVGDTIRVSLTGDPVEEVRVGSEILKSLGLREYGPTLISCPTCGRCRINLQSIAEAVEQRLTAIRKPIKVAVMGCVVNGPGEAKEADVGIAGGTEQGLIFRKGQIIRKVSETELVNSLFEEIDAIIREDI